MHKRTRKCTAEGCEVVVVARTHLGAIPKRCAYHELEVLRARQRDWEARHPDRRRVRNPRCGKAARDKILAEARAQAAERGCCVDEVLAAWGEPPIRRPLPPELHHWTALRVV